MALSNTSLSTLVNRHNKSKQELFDDAKAAAVAFIDGLADDPQYTDRQRLAIAEAFANFAEIIDDPAKRAAALAIGSVDVVDFLTSYGTTWELDNGQPVAIGANGRPAIRGAGRQQQGPQGGGNQQQGQQQQTQQRQAPGLATPPPPPTPAPVPGPGPAAATNVPVPPAPAPAPTPAPAPRGSRLRRPSRRGQPPTP